MRLAYVSDLISVKLFFDTYFSEEEPLGFHQLLRDFVPIALALLSSLSLLDEHTSLLAK